jgi:hypothetical protein
MEKSRIIVGFTIVVIISLLVLVIGYKFMDNTAHSLQDKSKSWMFKGAFATYEGQISSFYVPRSINETIQVIDLNATHVQIQTNSSITTSFAPTFSDQTILWINKTNVNFQPEGEKLIGTYNTEITVRNIGTRACIAYDYTNQAINATYYIDKEILWPMRIVYVTIYENQSYQIEFNLKDTNINGLN